MYKCAYIYKCMYVLHSTQLDEDIGRLRYIKKRETLGWLGVQTTWKSICPLALVSVLAVLWV